jgi:hypothetical protein
MYMKSTAHIHNLHHTLRPKEELPTARSTLLRRGRYCQRDRGGGGGGGAAGGAAAHEAVEDARTSSSSSSSRLWIREQPKYGFALEN